MKNAEARYPLYILPYIGLLLLVAWYIIHIKPIALLDEDSFGYLSPAIERQLTGIWHKGLRPMQYLIFLYVTLTADFKLNNIVIFQQILVLAGGGFLSAAWVKFVYTFKHNFLWWHLLGYFMLALYVSSTTPMYYAQFIGPELYAMFFMCVLIYCLVHIFGENQGNKALAVFSGIAVFINLYIINPMPKWVFAGIFIEIILVGFIVKSKRIPVRQKIVALFISHLAWCLLVLLPETFHPVESPQLERVFIEYEQMTFTHFNLLARDKSNFEVAEPLQDSLIQYFHESQKSPYPLLGFDSDNLMGGKAGAAIYAYYDYNYDSISVFFKKLCCLLVTKYPVALTGQITKQIVAFYVPNKIMHKNLCRISNLPQTYLLSRRLAMEFDPAMYAYIKEWETKNGKSLPRDLTASQYPPTSREAGLTIYEQDLPILFGTRFVFYRYFDYIFFGALVLFFGTRLWQGKLFEFHLITLLYLIIAVYVVTIAIVHTLDISRFSSDTTYPFLIPIPFMALAYSMNEILFQFQKWQRRKGANL